MSHLAVRPQVVCLICRIRASGSVPRASFSTTTKRFESLSVTERMRRRIWGTNSPPGQTDPYAQLTQEERERDLQRQKTAEVNERAADVEKKVSHVYVPASNWDGLESVGGFGDDSTATWDPEHQFQGFMTSAQLTSASELTMAIHQAAVEIYTLHGAQQSLASATKMEGSTGLTADVQIVPSNNALQVDLLYPSDKTRDDILSSVKTNVAGGPGDQKIEEGFDEKQEQGADAHREKALPSEHTDTHGKAEAKATEAWRPMAAWAIEEQRLRDHPTESHAKNIEQLEAQMSSWNPDWLSTPLTGPHIKFAMVKRVMQLTGRRIPDHIISKLGSLRDLHNFLMQSPKPKKLAHVLMEDEQLQSLPNVKVIPKRVTPINSDLAVGRWKVIENELLQRGLQVVGKS